MCFPTFYWVISQFTQWCLPNYIDVPPKLHWDTPKLHWGAPSQVTLMCLQTYTGVCQSYTDVPPNLLLSPSQLKLMCFPTFYWGTPQVTLGFFPSYTGLCRTPPSPTFFSKFSIGIWFRVVCNLSHMELSFASHVITIPKILIKNRLLTKQALNKQGNSMSHQL